MFSLRDRHIPEPNMNFYSNDIIDRIVDTEELDAIADKIEEFYAEVVLLCCKYASRVISSRYMFSLLMDERNKVVFRCMDTTFSIENCPSLLIYQLKKDPTNREITCYILMMCTKHSFKKLGYASKLFDDFVQYIREKTQGWRDKYDKVSIVLSSIDTAVTFYEFYGFRWTRKCLTDYPVLLQYEQYEDGKEYFMMELVL